jgi:CcmD family protein
VTGGAQYVVAAYAVVWVLVLAYVVMLGARTARVGRQVEAITRMLDRREAGDASTTPRDAGPPDAHTAAAAGAGRDEPGGST